MSPKKEEAVRYIALLRGINVGGHKKISMAELKDLLETSGFGNVKTYLATGNIAFDSPKNSPAVLEKDISAKLHDTFGMSIKVLIRPKSDIEKMIAADPFKGIKITKETRLYVTFLSKMPGNSLKIPYTSSDKSFKIIKLADHALFSVLNLADMGTIDAMAVIEKEFGKEVTTRNWNTILKIGDL